MQHKRKGFADLQRRLEVWLGPGEAMESNPTARAEGITPQRWQVGRVTVTHDYYYQFALYEKVLFDWAG